MKLLGSERVVTQNFEKHNYAEDYAGMHLSNVLIKGKAKVIHVVDKYKPYEDTVNQQDFLVIETNGKRVIIMNVYQYQGKRLDIIKVN